jgi:hypothetical protein
MTMAEPVKTDMAAADRLLAEVAGRDVAPPGADVLTRLTAQAMAAMPVVQVPEQPGWRGWLARAGRRGDGRACRPLDRGGLACGGGCAGGGFSG